jgi:hypothetical protein
MIILTTIVKESFIFTGYYPCSGWTKKVGLNITGRLSQGGVEAVLEAFFVGRTSSFFNFSPQNTSLPPNLIYISSMINELNFRKPNKSQISKKTRKISMNGQKNRAFRVAFSEFLKV